jgi:hypothetical protein
MRNKRHSFWENKSIGEFVTTVDNHIITYKLDEELNNNILIINKDGNEILNQEVSGIDQVESILKSRGLY